MTLRDEISALWNYPIREGGWDAAFHQLNVSGAMTQRRIVDVMLVICKKLDEYERRQASLDTKPTK